MRGQIRRRDSVCAADVNVEGRPVANLEGAAQMIAILSLLETKTKGNLTVEERQILEQVLYELRMRFVQAVGPSGDERTLIIEP